MVIIYIFQILPLASDYSLLERFSRYCNDTDVGLVKQALGSAIENLIFDYYVSQKCIVNNNIHTFFFRYS